MHMCSIIHVSSMPCFYHKPDLGSLDELSVRMFEVVWKFLRLSKTSNHPYLFLLKKYYLTIFFIQGAGIP